ncbi:MAG TPA: HEAT repeat domain-containing protein [Ktedonobacteraceae bacterium]|nr:HEAT repeat domain-containing protein [Ktedonobacteraceae bacterium]
MVEYPAYVRYAFRAIRVIDAEEYENEAIEAFLARWGDLALTTFARVLREGEYEDQQIAVFALGYTESHWAQDLLLPYLSHKRPEVRWAAALTLGKMRVEAAFLVLIQMLQEFFPPHPPADYSWYDVKHMHVAHLLGSWGKQEAVAALKETLQHIWRAELQLKAQGDDVQMEAHYEDALAYALGQLGAFDALADLEASPSRHKLWAITLVLGYLNMERLARDTLLGFLAGPFGKENRAALLAPVPALLQEKMGFSEQEAADFSEIYLNECEDRLFG